jgi:hypothetical protein
MIARIGTGLVNQALRRKWEKLQILALLDRNAVVI